MVMHRFMHSLILGCLCLCICPSGIVRAAEEGNSPESVPAVNGADTEAVSKVPHPKNVQLNPARLEFGEFREGQVRRRRVEIVNKNDAPVTINRVSSPCPCMELFVLEKTIPAKSSVFVEVVQHSLGQIGEKEWKIFFEIQGAEKGLLTATAHTHVKRVPALLMVHPAAMQFGTIRADAQSKAQAYIFNLAKVPLDVLSMKTTLDGVRVEMPKGTRVAPGEHGKIELLVDPGVLSQGAINGELTIETSCWLHRQIRIPINGTVRGGAPKADSAKDNAK